MHPWLKIARLADELVDTGESDVMSGAVVFFVGIAEANQQLGLIETSAVELDAITYLRSFLEPSHGH